MCRVGDEPVIFPSDVLVQRIGVASKGEKTKVHADMHGPVTIRFGKACDVPSLEVGKVSFQTRGIVDVK